jgi:N-methylhydantoinase A
MTAELGGSRLAVDIGGTFTDVVLQTPGGYFSGKILTTHDAPEEGVLRGVREVLAKAGVAASQVAMTIHGTTLATNALIERRGAVTGLLATAGFRDVLEFAFEHRFEQYDLGMVRPQPLVPRPLRLEVPERVAADGAVLLALDEAAVGAAGQRLVDAGAQAIAVSYLHSYINPSHEQRTRDILQSLAPQLEVSLSCEICPEIREYERTSTTVANAYVQPLIAGYLSKLDAGLRALGCRGPLLLIMSSGSLTSVETAMRLPIRLVESGPAGGAILGQHIARELAAPRVISFDMGGTTAKVVLVNDYQPKYARAMEVARVYRQLPGSGFPLRIPVVDMIEIGAGGGSIAHVDALDRIVVGPESAGSMPGPACYGLGGDRPAVTDADLVLGKIDGENFADGTMRLDVAAAKKALLDHVGGRLGADPVAAAAGVAEIVDENMANAARVHAIDNGEEIEGRVLIVMGGAAPLHAARLAQKLGIASFVIPQGAGVGSAHGFLKAPVAYEAVNSRFVSLAAFDEATASGIFHQLRVEAERVLRPIDATAALVEHRVAYMRYRGQGHELPVEIPARDYTAQDAALLQELFEAQYRKAYKRVIPGLGAEVLTWILTVTIADSIAAAPPVLQMAAQIVAKAQGQRQIFDPALGAYVSAALFSREAMAPGSIFDGPAVVTEAQTTTYVPAEFSGRVSEAGHLVMILKGSVT